MVRCCSLECSVQWYHYHCIGLDSVDADEDWWCSDDCERSGSYVYCICNKSTSENNAMVQCDLQGECERNEWYHPSCICLTVSQLPGRALRFSL